MAFSLCNTGGANTGGILCDDARGITKKLFIFNGEFDEADYADVDTFMSQFIAFSKLSRNATNKVFPFSESQDIADASEANKEGTLGLGFKQVLQEGKPAYTIKMFAGNIQSKQFRKWNNKTVRILEYDSNGKLWGTASNGKFIGVQAKMFFTGLKSATGQNVEEGVVTLTLSILDTTEYYDNAYLMPIVGNINDVIGLVDVQLKEPVAHTTNVYKIKAFIPTSQIGQVIDLYDDYADALADADLWVFSIPTTTAVKDTVNRGWIVTLDSAAHTALPAGAKIPGGLAAPELLDDADVTGIEGIQIVLTK